MAHDTRMQETIPQLDSPVSIRSRTRGRISESMRVRQESFQRTTRSHRREYPAKSSDNIHSDGDHIENEGPLKKEGTKIKMEGYQIEEIIRVEDILQEHIQIKVEELLNEEDPLMIEAPLMMGEPLEMDDILDTLEDEDHWDPKDPLDL